MYYYETFLNAIKDVLIIIDAKTGRIICLNKSACDFYGCTEENLRAKTIYDFSNAEDIPFMKVHFMSALKKDLLIQIEQFNILKEKIVVNIRVQKVQFMEKDCLLLTIRDAKDKEKRVLKYVSESNHEDKFHNKDFLVEQLEKDIAISKRIRRKCALHVIEVGNFNEINLQIGIFKMEVVLKDLMKKIKDEIRKEDTLCSIGINTFGVIQTMLSKDTDSIVVAKRIIRKMSQPFEVDLSKYYLTINIGISITNDNCDNPETMLKNSYSALKDAKAKGAGKYEIYAPSFGGVSVENLKASREYTKIKFVTNKDPYNPYKK